MGDPAARKRRVDGTESHVLRLAVTTGAALVALVACLLLQPGRAEVNGVDVPIGRGWTVGDCARARGVRTREGDLLDVEGQVLLAGGGRKVQSWVNGRQTSLVDRPVAGDRLLIAPAADVTESIDDEIDYLHGRCIDERGRSVAGEQVLVSLPGIKRTRRGGVSEKLVRAETTFASLVVYSPDAPSRPPCIAFTFDDGPCNPWTGRVLDVLAEYGVRATFFVLGQNVAAHPDTFARTIREGHEVGAHSWGHPHYPRLSTEAAKRDLQRTLDVMRRQGADRVRWFRPPYGEWNSRIGAVAEACGTRIAMWDIDTQDWRRPGVDAICSRVLAKARDGAVVLMHDGPAKREQTVAALRRLIPELRRRGYLLVTMSEAKRVVPLFGGEVILKAGDATYHLVPMAASTIVEVGGKPVTLPFAPLAIGADILLPVRPIAEALGAQTTYDKPTETVTVTQSSQKAVFRLDSVVADINGEERVLSVPPVLYLGHALAPLSVLKGVLGVGCVHDATKHILRLTPVPTAEDHRDAPAVNQDASLPRGGDELHADLRHPRGAT